MSTLSAEFLRAVVLTASFRGDDHDRACAALLMLALRYPTIDAGQLPAEILNGSKTISGIATGALIAQNLLEVCGRVRSSSPLANGRKVSELRIPAGRLATVRCWLSRHGYTDSATPQTELSLA